MNDYVIKAYPLLSLVALDGERITEHILFTKVDVVQNSKPFSAWILTLLAVHPDVQKRGIGGQLIKEGLEHLKQSDVELVFVLGHKDYYRVPAVAQGFEAPYTVPEEHVGVWMVQKLCS